MGPREDLCFLENRKICCSCRYLYGYDLELLTRLFVVHFAFRRSVDLGRCGRRCVSFYLRILPCPA
jgi:hypothetical protein